MLTDAMREDLSAEQRRRFNRESLRSGIYVFVFFCAVFYGADMFARLRDKHLQLYFAWERSIPFYPPAYLAYYSVFILPLLMPVFLRTEHALRLWRKRMLAAIGIAGLVFLLCPAELGYPTMTGGDWLLIRKLTPVLTGRYNLVPSLHIALMVIMDCSIWPCLSKSGKRLLLLWGIALSISTVMTHQHHVLDVAAGCLLGFIVFYWIRARKPENQM